jgi:hypothetical protein
MTWLIVISRPLKLLLSMSRYRSVCNWSINCNCVILLVQVDSMGFWRWWMTQNYWVLGLYPSSRILGNRGHDVSEIGSVSIFRWERKTPTQLGSLDRANPTHCQFPKRRVLYCLEFRTMEKVQEPSNSSRSVHELLPEATVSLASEQWLRCPYFPWTTNNEAGFTTSGFAI